MALSTQIEPVTIIHEVGVTLACDILHYDLIGNSCQVSWWLLDENEIVVHRGIWFVTPDVMENWGTDDSVIIEGLATALGFTIVTS